MKEENGILWSIDENGLLKIEKSENGDGTIPVAPVSDSKKVYNDEGYENTTFTYDGTFHKPWTFEEEQKVLEIIIEDGITEIPYGTFSNFKNLKKITIPNSVQYIGPWAFRCCENLEEINLPEGIGAIGKETFLSCKKLHNLLIPNSVTIIDNEAFESCKSISEIQLPEGLTYIGEKAFSYCSELKTITIPDSVNRIGKDAFKFCDSLRKAYISKDKIDEFSIAFEKPNSYRNPDGSIYVVGTTLKAKRGESVFTKLFGK